MRLYGYRFADKAIEIPSHIDIINVESLSGWKPDSPSLLILHPLDRDQLDGFWVEHKGDIERGSLALLVIGTQPFQRPDGCSPSYLHCLSYAVPTIPSYGSQDSGIIKAFRKLCEGVYNLTVWPPAAEMEARVWSLVERVRQYPEFLISAYLILIAQAEGLKITADDVPAEVWDKAAEEYSETCKVILGSEETISFEVADDARERIRLLFQRIQK